MPGSVLPSTIIKTSTSKWKTPAIIARYHRSCLVEKTQTSAIATLMTTNTTINFLGSETSNPHFSLFSKFGIQAISQAYLQLPYSEFTQFFKFQLVLYILVSISYYVKNIISDISAIIFQLIYMEQAIVKARQEKQSYICENIDPNYYEEFHEFCSTYAGEIDIDKWPVVYVHELVAKFKEDLKKKNDQEDNHQRSFAIYQTTSGDNQISGSSNLQMSEILDSFQQPEQNKPRSNQPSTKQAVKQSPQNQKAQTAFTKKQPGVVATPSPASVKATTSPAVTKQKAGDKKISALELLDSAFDQINPTQRSKIQQNAEKVNKSFFDSVNFWEVPKLDDIKQPKTQQTKEAPTSAVQSPKKDFKSIKLNLNVGQLNQNANKSGSDKKNEQFATKNKNVEIQTFNYNEGNNADNFIKINSINAISSLPDNKSQFDTFSIIAQEEIQKKRSSTLAVIPDVDSDNRKKSSTIKLKQIKDLKTSPSTSSKYSIKEQYKGPRIFKSDFVDQVFCVKSAVRPNSSHENLRIEIKNYEIVQRSIFSSNYLMYNMKVLPMGTICKRNYEDFSKLKSTLQKFYPGIQMPYLQKQGWRSDTSQQYAKKQIQMIEFFMADILRNKQLQNSRVTQQFLSIQDHKKMKRKFQQYDRMTKLKSIEELCLLDGKVEVALTEQQRIYNENMSKLSTKLQTNIEKYRRNCETLSNQYSQVMSTILVIDDILKEMDKDVEQFNKNVSIKEIQTIESGVKKMRDHFKQNYFRVKFEKNIIEDNILPFFRYEKQNVKCSKAIIELSNNMTNRYLKRSQSESSSNTDSSYLNSGLSEQKQGILQQSKNLLVLKYQAGYLQAQASSELQRIMNSLGKKIEVLWKEIGVKYLDQLAKSVNIWSQIS